MPGILPIEKLFKVGKQNSRTGNPSLGMKNGRVATGVLQFLYA